MSNQILNQVSSKALLIFSGLLLVVSFVISNHSLVANTRGIEQYWATVKQNPAAFAKDEYALSLASNNNSIIGSIIEHTTTQSRKLIYDLVFLASLWSLILLGRSITKDPIPIVLLVALFVYNSYNSLIFNVVLLTNDFVGTFLSTPFILLSLKFLIDQKFILSSICAAIAFYMHPGVCLWYFIVIFSAQPFLIANNLRQKNPSKNVFESLKPYFIFLGAFLIFAFPRIYQTLLVKPLPSVIDPQLRFDIFKYAWATQTSLWLCLTKGGDNLFAFVVLFSNIIVFLLIINHFKNQTEKNVRLIFLMYVGSFLFLIFNEILIHFFDFHFAVIYGLSRSSGINALMMVILLALMITDKAKSRSYVETFAWGIFFANYTLIHYKSYSPVLQICILFVILMIRITKVTKGIDKYLEEKDSKNAFISNFIQKSLWCFIILIFLITGARIYNKLKHPEPPDYYREAIEYVNQQNFQKSLVLFPFHNTEDFLIYSHNPGFFSSHYIVVFIDLYGYGGETQEKAYQKFKMIEQDLSLGDTLSLPKTNINLYLDTWTDAWAKKVNVSVIEQWAKNYPIGYIIREKKLSKLPYQLVYENNEYYVYRRG